MNIFRMRRLSGKRRIRQLINQSVSQVTDRYKKDNLLLVRQYMEEQKRQGEVDDSIRYAKHLQNALLPAENELQEMAGDAFVFSQPRDTLNGDFAWYTRSGNKIVLAVADCTGHGIPGALMSVLGLSLLNQVVLEERNYEPSHILRRVDDRMRTTFQRTEETRHSYDGMDIALCTIDLQQQKILFSGAMRPFWLMHKGQLLEFSGSRYPINGLRLEKDRVFKSTEVEFAPGDFIYLFTDGFTDQFGGKEDKKMTRARLRQLVEMIHENPARQQKEQLQEFFLLWKGHRPQTDDATMIGLRL
jgi:serine phosphatase RsbU (regulator of sigma subunit)